uniref:Uncharacterized protein n=1 Tax=Physcomitrium patens TaxID=3218 RepID=A0A2K1K1X6_PHYPA|nr:hypothetical protein PHYPA_012251 [Physcomitrium patens]
MILKEKKLCKLRIPRITKNLLSIRSIITNQRSIVKFELMHYHIISVIDPSKPLARGRRDLTNGL